jgi:xanthine dehydrogenase YagS FAD-binding subunit
MIPKIGYARPHSLKEAVKELSAPGSMAHAGGTDLLGCLRDGIATPAKVISLSGLSDLKGIARTADGGLRIGALTTLTEVAEDQRIKEEYTALAEAAGSAASPQLRNQGTLGGNLCQRPRCWYFRGEFHCRRKGGEICYAMNGRNEFHCIFGGQNCFIVHPSDSAPALVALEARVRIANSRGTRTIPLDSFFIDPAKDVTRENILLPGEIITEVLLPAPIPQMRSSYRKARARGAWDFALAGVAIRLRFAGKHVDQARIVLSGVAPIPWRTVETEKSLSGKILDEETAARAAESAVQNAEPLSDNAYKIHLTQGIVHESLMTLRPE